MNPEQFIYFGPLRCPCGGEDREQLAGKAEVLSVQAAPEEKAEATGSPVDSDDLARLVAEGRERGYLTFDEISATLEEVEVTKDEIRDLHAHLVEHGVDVIAAGGVSAYGEPKNETAPPKAPELDLRWSRASTRFASI